MLLLVSLFLPWYSVAGQDLTAWQAMAVDDLLIAAAALVAVGGAVVVATPRLAGFSVGAMTLGSLPGLIALILVIFRLASPAPEATAETNTVATPCCIARTACATPTIGLT